MNSYEKLNMALTRIDCQIYRERKGAQDSSFYSVFNPCSEPGSLVAIGSVAARDNLGGQVACKLSLEHFTSSILESVNTQTKDALKGLSAHAAEDQLVQIVEEAFRHANNSVYEFGHKLAAGGRMAASLVGYFIRERVISVGRAGNTTAYLLRGSEVCPFFNDQNQTDRTYGYVGENSFVTVELSSIELKADDMVIAFPTMLQSEQLSKLATHAFRAGVTKGIDLKKLAQDLYGEESDVAFMLLAQVGPEAIYLNKQYGIGVHAKA